jgi:hypothetical protein
MRHQELSLVGIKVHSTTGASDPAVIVAAGDVGVGCAAPDKTALVVGLARPFYGNDRHMARLESVLSELSGFQARAAHRPDPMSVLL